MQDSKVVKVELRVKLATLLVHGIGPRLFICQSRAIARLMEALLCVAAIVHSFCVLVILEEELHGHVVFALIESKLGAQVRTEALCLLASGATDTFIELSRVLRRSSPVLASLLEAFLRGLVILLEKLKGSFESVEDHLILLDVNVFRRHGVLTEECSKQNAERVLANYVLFDAFHAWYTPLLL